MNSQPSNELLLWADCEFTGLPIAEGHKILEIGVLVTDLSLREIDTYSSFIHYNQADVELLMSTNPWWDEHKQDKPRMLAGVAGGASPQEVDEALANLTDEYFTKEKPALCGNSIHSDKSHIDVELGSFAARLSYQIIDVSSLKLVAKKYLGVEYPHKSHLHFALDDIRESVDEMKFILNALGVKKFTS